MRNAVYGTTGMRESRGAGGDMVGLQRDQLLESHIRGLVQSAQGDLEHPDGVEAFACPGTPSVAEGHKERGLWGCQSCR